MGAFQKPHVLRSQQSLRRVSRGCVFWSQGWDGISRRRSEASESTERESVTLMTELSLSGSSSFSISRLNTHKMFPQAGTAFLGRHQNQYYYWEVVLYAIMNIILGKEKYQQNLTWPLCDWESCLIPQNQESIWPQKYCQTETKQYEISPYRILSTAFP